MPRYITKLEKKNLARPGTSDLDINTSSSCSHELFGVCVSRKRVLETKYGGTLEHNMDHFIKECAHFFHNR